MTQAMVLHWGSFFAHLHRLSNFFDCGAPTQMKASKQNIKHRKVQSTLSISLFRRRGRYHIQPLPLHTHVNMFGLRREECAPRLPYKISGPFPRHLPFMPPLAKHADATASIIQSQFSCSGATCYGSVVPGSPPQAAAAMRGLTSLTDWQEFAVKRYKVPVRALMKAGHGGFFGVSVSQKKHVNTFCFSVLSAEVWSFSLQRFFIYIFIYYFAESCQSWFCSRYQSEDSINSCQAVTAVGCVFTELYPTIYSFKKEDNFDKFLKMQFGASLPFAVIEPHVSFELPDVSVAAAPLSF